MTWNSFVRSVSTRICPLLLGRERYANRKVGSDKCGTPGCTGEMVSEGLCSPRKSIHYPHNAYPHRLRQLMC